MIDTLHMSLLMSESVNEHMYGDWCGRCKRSVKRDNLSIGVLLCYSGEVIFLLSTTVKEGLMVALGRTGALRIRPSYTVSPVEKETLPLLMFT